MPLFKKKKKFTKGSRNLSKDLQDAAEKRAHFLHCSGMHTKAVETLVENVCNGKVDGPCLSFVAPALYEGVSEFLEKQLDAYSDLATYSALYMGLVATAGYTGIIPVGSINMYYNGVFASMMLHSGVVLSAVLYRLAAVSHLRDSDKLLFLYRGRYVPLGAMFSFLYASFSATFALMNAVYYEASLGSGCFASNGDPTMTWNLWWNQWTRIYHRPTGAGIVYEKGEAIQNPWIETMKAMNISNSRGRSNDQDVIDMYNEFMQDYFGFAQPCSSSAMLRQQTGGGWEGSLVSMVQKWVWVYLIPAGLFIAFTYFWVAPTRHIFNYWSTNRERPIILRYTLGFLGSFSFYFFGPCAMHKNMSGDYGDPFDMTEVWNDYQIRKAYAKELAAKDKDGDGKIELKELKAEEIPYTMSPAHHEQDSSISSSSERLTTLLNGLISEDDQPSVQHAIEEAKLDFGTLVSLASADIATCISVLEKAGIKTLEHKVKIAVALHKESLGPSDITESAY